MRYYCVNFQITPCEEAFADVLSATIAALGFDSFAYTETGLQAYIPCTMLDTDKIDLCLAGYPVENVEISYSVEAVPDENWNTTWEQEGFHPIHIPGGVYVHDTRSDARTDVPYDIVINASMTFGTGSHETTSMLLGLLAGMPLEGQRVVDAGTGTGILAILCSMRGACGVLAYDIDERSVQNAQDNIAQNGCKGISVKLGDCHVLEQEEPAYGLVIANINRNILLHDMPYFRQVLKKGGKLLLSGFYQQDTAMLCGKATELGMKLVRKETSGDWAALLFETDAARGMDM